MTSLKTPNLENKSRDNNDPYRTDPLVVANQAMDLAVETCNTVNSKFDSLNKRISKLESTISFQHSFFVSNWNKFWSRIGNLINFLFSLEFFIVGTVAAIISLFIYFSWDSNNKDTKQAEIACQSANMTLVSESNFRTTCIRSDGAVLVIQQDGTAPTLTIPLVNSTTNH